MKLPLGVTLGDANGVGPEILLKSFRDGQLPADLIVFGDLAALDFYDRKFGFGVRLREAQPGANLELGALNVVDSGQLTEVDIRPGILSRQTGSAARANVVAATQAALSRQIAGMVTLPINKAATQMSDPEFVGHTELIGALCGVSDVTIMLASPQLIVTHVSTHCSLQEAIERARRERIQTIIRLTWEAARKLIPQPRIAVAGLNPHAGEGGLFGREEIEEIQPAILWAKAQGSDCCSTRPSLSASVSER